MNRAQLSDKLFVAEYSIKQAERKLHDYVKKAAWSEQDCYQVDMLYQTIKHYQQQIDTIREVTQDD
jgi:hypothetical protein